MVKKQPLFATADTVEDLFTEFAAYATAADERSVLAAVSSAQARLAIITAAPPPPAPSVAVSGPHPAQETLDQIVAAWNLIADPNGESPTAADEIAGKLTLLDAEIRQLRIDLVDEREAFLTASQIMTEAQLAVEAIARVVAPAVAERELAGGPFPDLLAAVEYLIANQDGQATPTVELLSGGSAMCQHCFAAI